MAKKPLPIEQASAASAVVPPGGSVLDILRSATAGMPSLTNPQGGAAAGGSLPAPAGLPRSGIVEILPPESKPDSVEDYVTTIARLYEEAEERFVQIGRHLIDAKARLQHGEWGRLVSQLPFSHRTATMLITAARAIINRTIEPARAPRSWANVYLIAAMSDEERRVAGERGVIRPDVTRREILEFRRGFSTPAAGVGQGDGWRPGALDEVADELARLIEEKKRIERRIAELQRRHAAASGGVPALAND